MPKKIENSNKNKEDLIDALLKDRQENMNEKKELIKQVHKYKEENTSLLKEKKQYGFPPGHFYSPIPNIEDIKKNEATIFNIPDQVLGINLNTESQLELFDELKKYYHELPFCENKIDNLRYYYNNDAYSYGDAIIYYSMIRNLRPKKVIEIGIGYSSCVLLDTNEYFFDDSISCSFIDPYPEVLLSLLKDHDTSKINLINKKLQDVDINLFKDLSKGDILFIDSTHVSKVNSDVNYIFSKILPNIKKGVYIHFHDIFYPFEYPKNWIYQGWYWNECYMLKCFLQYNNSFKIKFFNTYLYQFFKEKLIKHMPLIEKNSGGSIWISKEK